MTNRKGGCNAIYASSHIIYKQNVDAYAYSILCIMFDDDDAAASLAICMQMLTMMMSVDMIQIISRTERKKENAQNILYTSLYMQTWKAILPYRHIYIVRRSQPTFHEWLPFCIYMDRNNRWQNFQWSMIERCYSCYYYHHMEFGVQQITVLLFNTYTDKHIPSSMLSQYHHQHNPYKDAYIHQYMITRCANGSIEHNNWFCIVWKLLGDSLEIITIVWCIIQSLIYNGGILDI